MDRLVCVISDMVEVLDEHKDLERFRPPDHLLRRSASHTA
jgi:hypothetical protein